MIDAARAGDEGAYAALIRRYSDLAFRAAYLVTRNSADAEDACQEAFAKAYRALLRFRVGAPFRPWLLRIVTNEARNRMRSNRRHENLRIRAVSGIHVLDADPADRILTEEARRSLLVAVEDLSLQDREIITYRFFLDLSVAETAQALSIAEGTVKSRLARALSRLSEHIVEEEHS